MGQTSTAAVACLLSLAWGCVACGGDDSGTSTTDAATSAATSTTSTTSGPDATTGTDDSSAGTSSGGAESTDGSGGMADSSSGAPDDGVVTFDEIQPIFASKCTPCHTGVMFGGHNVGGSDVAAGYADTQLDADAAVCRGLSKGACLLVRIQSGEMPMSGGCSGDPARDAGATNCLTQDEQDMVQLWLDDGQLPPA